LVALDTDDATGIGSSGEKLGVMTRATESKVASGL
jgi:hypothetical protein